MAKRHNDDDREKDEPTNENNAKDAPTETGHETEDPTRSGAGPGRATSRRTFMKTVGAAAAVGASASLFGRVSAVSDLDTALDPSGEVTLDPGEYSWDGSGLDISSDAACIGGGNPGDVVLNLESGTMDGSVAGRLENVVVRGANPESKSGIDLQPGATLDGFHWPEGGQQSEDRALYTPNGGNDRLTIRNSSWAWMVNNGAYVDKPPVTMENCVSVNNNIAGIRVGHRDGTDTGETTYVRNCLVAVTDDILNDDTNSPNARGLRLRSPANLVIENCWFVYLDVSGAADLIELHDGAAGSTVTIRNCAFYNDSGGDLVRDKSGGSMDVTIENCTVAGSGSQNIEPDYSGSGVSEDGDASFPLPSQITGYAVADDIEGVGEGIGPWDGEASAPGNGDDDTNDRTIALHASPDNESAVDASFSVDGDLEFAAEAEPDVDTIETNDDGTMTATSVSLSPDELDSYRFTGGVVDYSVPEDATVDVSVDGTTTTFADLVGESSDDDSADDGSSGDDSDNDDSSSDDSNDGSNAESDVLEVVARQTGPLNYEFVVDGSAELHETSDAVTAGNGDSITDNGDGTVTVTGFTGNDGFGDAYLVDGTVTSFDWEESNYDFDVLLNGETVDPTSFEESDDSSDGDSSDDGSSDDGSNDDGTDDGSNDDGTDDSDNDGTDDPDNDGSSGDDSDNDDSNNEDGSSGDDSLPHLVTFDGSSADDVTTYTFTVSGEVSRDEGESVVSGDGMTWDALEDIAQDGKVIGLVGSGVDAYRFGGAVTEITVDGNAAVSIERDA